MVSESQTADGASTGSSRRKLAVRGSIFELTGFGASQVVRLGGNLILTRLLFPEAFGLAALVNIALQGLELLSDVGFGQSIVQNKRGEDPVFLNTAWTLQILRGVILSVLCLLLAHPFSLLYEEPILKWLLVVGAGQSLLQGFLSTSLSTLRRRVHVAVLASLVAQSSDVDLESLQRQAVEREFVRR